MVEERGSVPALIYKKNQAFPDTFRNDTRPDIHSRRNIYFSPNGITLNDPVFPIVQKNVPFLVSE